MCVCQPLCFSLDFCFFWLKSLRTLGSTSVPRGRRPAAFLKGPVCRTGWAKVCVCVCLYCIVHVKEMAGISSIQFCLRCGPLLYCTVWSGVPGWQLSAKVVGYLRLHLWDSCYLYSHHAFLPVPIVGPWRLFSGVGLRTCRLFLLAEHFLVLL